MIFVETSRTKLEIEIERLKTLEAEAQGVKMFCMGAAFALGWVDRGGVTPAEFAAKVAEEMKL